MFINKYKFHTEYLNENLQYHRLNKPAVVDDTSYYYQNGIFHREQDEWIIESWNFIVTKRDLVWVLGDVAMGKSKEGKPNLKKISKLNGTKKLILGNHDELPIEEYLNYFQVIKGFTRYKGYWLSHAPIHPLELRGKKNIHGHVHHNSIDDRNYINVCVEANLMRNGTILSSYDELI